MKIKRNLTRADIVEIVNVGSKINPEYETLPNRFILHYKHFEIEKIKDFLKGTEEFINGTMDFVSCDEPVKGYASKMYLDSQEKVKKQREIRNKKK